MAALQGYYLTYVEAKSPIDLEKKLFKIKVINDGKLTIEKIPEKFPGLAWFWTNQTKLPLNFISQDRIKNKKEAENA